MEKERPVRTLSAALHVDLACKEDAEELAELRTEVALDLTRRFGEGHWSAHVSDKGVLWHLRLGDVLAARAGGRILGTLALAKRKPRAIDPKYFTRARRPCHLTSMAVRPAAQRGGVGRTLMAAAEARSCLKGHDAIRLDAYQGDAGAGPFYEKCGYHERGFITYCEAPLIYFEKLLAAQ